MRIPVMVGLAVGLAAVALEISAGAIDRQALPLPERATFIALVRSAIRVDPDLQKDFTYIERRREVKFSTLGKVSVGPLRTFEVYPTAEPGDKYKRLIAIDGRPLDAGELARRDREHQRELDNEMRQSSRERTAEQARQRERAERDRAERLAILQDALSVFDFTPVARELVDGEPTIVAALTPRAGARVATRQGNWMKVFEGRAWFVEQDGQLARLDMHAVDEVSIGWGLIGRLHKGSRLLVERKPVGHLWLPSRLTFDATGRTLLFRTFELNAVTEYSDYKAR